MRLTLLLLLLPLQALAVNTQMCPNGKYGALVENCDNGACCPSYLTSADAGANVTSTGFDAEVTTDQTTTVYGAARLDTNSVGTCAEIQAGTGYIDNQSVTPAAGLADFTGGDAFTGLSASTTYVIDFCQPYDSQIIDIVSSPDVTTIAGGGGGGNDLTGTGYFVGSGGSDSNDGLSHANRWATLSKVESDVTAIGSNVYVLAGTTYEDDTLNIDWGGESGDRAIVACYYDNGGTPEECTGAQTLPEINGTFESACEAAQNCLINSGSAVPANAAPGGSGAVVQISGDYTTLRGIRVQDSAWVGVMISGDYSYVEDGEVERTAGSAISTANGLTGVRVWNNLTQNSVICDRDSYEECSVGCPLTPNCGAGQGGGHPPNIKLASRSAVGASALGNTIRDSYGEGISCNRGSTYCHVIGNIITGTRAASVLLDSSGDKDESPGGGHVVESNIIFASTDLANYPNIANPIRPTHEKRGAEAEHGENFSTLIRNNLIIQGTGNGACTFAGNRTDASDGHTVYDNVYYMSCIDGQATRGTYAQSKSSPDRIEQHVENSIVYAPDVSQLCRDNGTSTYDNNYWSSTPDAACQDAGDQSGEPSLVVGDLDTLSYTSTSPPTFDDYEYSGSGVTGVGDADPQETSALDITDFPHWNDITWCADEYGTSNFTEAQWEKRAGYDGRCEIRDATNPDIGAVEYTP